MKRYNPPPLLTAVAVLWTAIACVEDLNWETNYEKKPVINCVLCPNEVQTLRLSYNNQTGSDIFRDFENIEHAKATLWCDGNEVGTFTDIRFGRYTLNHRPKTGATYRLEVRLEDGRVLWAETTFPKPVRVRLNTANRGDEFRRHLIQENVREPYWIFHLNRSEDILAFPATVTPDDHLVMEIGSDHPDRDDFNTTGPVMFSHSTGGGFGTTKEHLAYLRIAPKPDRENASFCLEGLLSSLRALIIIRSVSPEYDAYLKSTLEKMHAHFRFEDPTSWLEEVDPYSHIEGGLGIFGAWADRVLYISPIP